MGSQHGISLNSLTVPNPYNKQYCRGRSIAWPKPSSVALLFPANLAVPFADVAHLASFALSSTPHRRHV
jgi:hypothetical protein